MSFVANETKIGIFTYETNGQMKSKTFYGIIFGFILLLIGIIVYLILTRPDSEKPAIIKHETEIKQDTRRIDSLLLRQEELRLQLKTDSIKAIEAQRRFKMRIATLEKKLSVIKTEVQPLIDSLPILKIYTDMQDSVISVQKNRINELENGVIKAQETFNRLILASDEKFNLAVEVNQHYRAINQIRGKENRRLKKANRLLLVAVPVGFVAGVVLSQ